MTDRTPSVFRGTINGEKKYCRILIRRKRAPLDEAIQFFEGEIQDIDETINEYTDLEAQELRKAQACFVSAILAIRAQQELTSSLKVLESNEPLTLDELRKMNGEPVWFETDCDTDKGWHVCHGEYKGRYIACDSGSCYDFGFFLGGHIVAYRHPPKEDAHAE